MEEATTRLWRAPTTPAPDDAPTSVVPLDAADEHADRDDTGRPPKTRMVFIDICRALGAILVVYSHLTEHWSRQHGHNDNGAHSPVIDVLNAILRDPLHLQRQGLGQIAVPVFFLISGFVVTPIALKQGQLKFTINRTLRIYPALMFVVLLTAVVLLLGMDPLSSGNLRTVTPLTVLTNLLLVNYVILPQVVLVGVAWTLIVEVLFYVLLIVLLPLLRRNLAVALGIELGFVLAVLLTARSFGDSYFLFAVAVSYIPIILLGQIIWAGYHREIPRWLAGLYLPTAWALYVAADLLQMGRLDRSYNLALAYAVLAFLLGLFAENRLNQYRFWTEISERTYSIYLMHGLVAFPVLTALSGILPFELSALVGVVATAAGVEVCYRFVEKPSHQLARRLTRRAPQHRPEDELADEVDEYDEDGYEADFDGTDYDDAVDEAFDDSWSDDGPHRPVPAGPRPWASPMGVGGGAPGWGRPGGSQPRPAHFGPDRFDRPHRPVPGAAPGVPARPPLPGPPPGRPVQPPRTPPPGIPADQQPRRPGTAAPGRPAGPPPARPTGVPPGRRPGPPEQPQPGLTAPRPDGRPSPPARDARPLPPLPPRPAGPTGAAPPAGARPHWSNGSAAPPPNGTGRSAPGQDAPRPRHSVGPGVGPGPGPGGRPPGRAPVAPPPRGGREGDPSAGNHNTGSPGTHNPGTGRPGNPNLADPDWGTGRRDDHDPDHASRPEAGRDGRGPERRAPFGDVTPVAPANPTRWIDLGKDR